MPALPEGTYTGIVLSSKPTKRNRLHYMDVLLYPNNERVEVVAFDGRVRAVMLGNARLKFQGVGQPWLPPADRSVPLPVLSIELGFNPKHPEHNHLINTRRTGEFVTCDIRHNLARMDFEEF